MAFRFFRQLLEKVRPGRRQAHLCHHRPAKGRPEIPAAAEGYESFVVPDDIGGRYSVLTAVVCCPLPWQVLMGQLMAGAASMMTVCAQADMEKNPAWQYAAARYELQHRGMEIEVLACFDPFFRFMAEWWKQLYGESEGKEGKAVPGQRRVYCGPALHGAVSPGGPPESV